MVSEQLRRYPNFSLSMHLAPWASRSNGLYSLVHDYVCANFFPGPECTTEDCCSSITLTAKEFQFSITNRNYLHIKQIINASLIKKNRLHGQPQLYTCKTRACELINTTNATESDSTQDSFLQDQELISTTEATALLNCSNPTVLWLADYGFLKKENANKIRGPGRRNLLQKSSIIEFAERCILVGEISKAFNIAPREVVRITTKLNIKPLHPFRGPYVFDRIEIENVTELFQLEVNEKYPNLAMRAALTLLPNKGSTLPSPNSPQDMTPLYRRHCKICNGPHFSKKQLPKILNAMPRVIHFRFFASGLIQPHVTEHGVFCSQKDISYMINHLQQHISLYQAIGILECTPIRLNNLINLFDLKPSFKIKYASGETQNLYSRIEIESLTADTGESEISNNISKTP
jgi:hypothetical protein